MKKFSAFTIGILAGTAIGAGLGLLFAKEEGRDTRDKITYQFSRLQETLSSYFAKKQPANDATNQAKAEGTEHVKNTQRKVQELNDKFESITQDLAPKKTKAKKA